ncbi:MAG: family 2 glycosyl transferase, partial [Hymenobacteraceae bacterium]|nr:family 2 glycosyl transferase [Hymenobacteraceae bacterium]MDX5394863.1 family 2 glycosyl transferase [Hymenobacteraceae bacterium]MDX5510898.1 family 2 glycosyl transferase [Hymenobacteraceae bacterium]
YPGKVVFLKADAATVFTATQPSISSFVQQRVRWASKWRAYKNKKVQLLAVIVFLANLSVLIAAVAFWLEWLSEIALIGIVAAKFLTDFLFLYQILSFFKKKQYIWYMLPLQLVYVPYVLFTAVRGMWGSFNWKGRKVEIT